MIRGKNDESMYETVLRNTRKINLGKNIRDDENDEEGKEPDFDLYLHVLQRVCG